MKLNVKCRFQLGGRGIMVREVLGLVLASSVLAWGNSDTYYVPDDFNSIGEAVAAADQHDTVIVRAGTYLENVIVGKVRLTIRSEKGPETTIVKSRAAADGAVVFWVVADGVHIVGFTVEGNSGGSGVLLEGVKDCSVTNNVFSENKYGIYLKSDSKVNVIANNEMNRNLKGGLVLDDSSDNLVMDNAVSENRVGIIMVCGSEGEDAGVRCSGNIIRYNQVVKNEVGMAVLRAAGNYIYLNDFGENKSACGVYTVKANRWYTPEKRGYTYNGGSYTSFLGNFWDGYDGKDGNGDGVGDSVYRIGVEGDMYPLMKQVSEMGVFLYIEWSAKDSQITGVAAVDINRDGVQDFIVVTQKYICGYVFDGYAYSQAWKKGYKGDSIAVGDLSGDGVPEIVLGGNVYNKKLITVLDGYTYEKVWESESEGRPVRSVQVADVDGDGRAEIVAGAMDNGVLGGAYVYVFDGTTGELEWKSSDLQGGVRVGVGDVNGDGSKKIVCGTRDGYVYVFDGNTHEQEWKSDDLGGDLRGVVLSDIDGNGGKEIIIGNGRGDIYVFDGKSHEQKFRWHQPRTGWTIGLGVDDVDSDGVKEVVVGLMVGERLPAYGTGLVYVLDGKTFAIERQSEMLAQWVGKTGIAVADFDGDGEKEILTAGRGQIYMFTQ